jgi:hypothetical protein
LEKKNCQQKNHLLFSTMSLQGTEANSFLPNLPGYRGRKIPVGFKKQQFQVLDGQFFIKDDSLPLVNSSTLSLSDEDSMTFTIGGSPGKKVFI